MINRHAMWIWALAIAIGLILSTASAAQAQFVVSGTVVDEFLAPVAGVEVFLYDDQSNPIGIPQTLTDGSGFYSISGLPAADYGFEFVPPAPYLTVFQTPVTVSSNTTLDVTLQIGLILSGTITDTLGSPLPDIDLNVYDQVTGNKLDTPGDNSDSVGFYDVAIPAGTYRLRWRSTNTVMVPVEMENIFISGDTTIDVSLMPGFTVSGTVEDDLGAPVFDADLDFWYRTTGVPISTPGDNTDASGNFSVILPAGLLSANIEPLITDGLAAVDFDSILIMGDTSLSFTLYPGHYVSGFVRDLFSNGVSGVDIDVRDAVTHVKLPTPGDMTDATGFYQMVVPSGTFEITYQPPIASKLAPVILTNEVVLGDRTINVTVPNGIVLAGVVESSSGQGIADVDIDAKVSSTGANVPLVGDRTDATGFFQVVLEPGSYSVEIEPPASRFLAAERLLNLSLSNDTTISVALDTGLVINGNITDGSANPIPLVDIDALLSSSGDTVFLPGGTSNASGFYSVLVKPETYDLIYTPDSGSAINDTIRYLTVPITHDTTINVVFGGEVNHAPVLNAIGLKVATAGELITFDISASDIDNDSLILIAFPLPGTAAFVDHFNDSGTFTWTTTAGDAGVYSVTFGAYDGLYSDEELVMILITGGPGCCGIYIGGLTGNTNCSSDGKRNLADITRLIDRVYISKLPLCCEENGNVDGSLDGKINLSDITRLIDHVYLSKTETASCL